MAASWSNDEELFRLCRNELFSAVVGDILDAQGYLHQFLPPEIQPLRDDMVVVGRAMTVLEADDQGGENCDRRSAVLNQPFGMMLRALDELQPGEIYMCTGSSPTYALWGELMSTAARNRGALGAIVNGYSRDTRGILELGFPTFSIGRYAQDQRPRGKVVDLRCTIRFGGVLVSPGDLVFGDLDGVCVIPQEIESEVIRLALDKAHGERAVFDAIKGGMLAQEAWDRYGIM